MLPFLIYLSQEMKKELRVDENMMSVVRLHLELYKQIELISIHVMGPEKQLILMMCINFQVRGSGCGICLTIKYVHFT